MPLSIATAMRSPSSTRCLRSLAAASWRRTAASYFKPRFEFPCGTEYPNAIGPRKRPLHTIIPGMLVKNGRAVMPFGVIGSHYSATGHAHFLTRLLTGDLDPQAAAEAPRSFGVWREAELEPSRWFRHGGRRTRTSRSQDRLDHKAIGRLPSDPNRSRTRSFDRRIRPAQGRDGLRLLKGRANLVVQSYSPGRPDEHKLVPGYDRRFPFPH